MNCYGSRPLNTQPVQSVDNMNTYYNSMNNISTNSMYDNMTGMQEDWSTTTSSEWSKSIPVDPDIAICPQTVMNTMPNSMSMPTPIPTQIPEPLPPTLTEAIYTSGYLMQHLGEVMRVEFLIGNNLTDRVGRLKQVGASFIVLQSLDNGCEIVCDIYSIKFVVIIQDTTNQMLLGTF